MMFSSSAKVRAPHGGARVTRERLDHGHALLAALNKCFQDDPDIDEFGFLLMEQHGDEQEIVCGEHKLGVLFASTFDLCVAANHVLATTRPLLSQLGGLSAMARKRAVESVLSATRALVLLNADHYTAWNARKWLVRTSHLAVVDDLGVVDLVFTKHPKSDTAWAHRLWLLEHGNALANHLSVRHELDVCARASEIHPKNYYAWTHRRRVLMAAAPDVLLGEFEAMERWCRMHVSDHASFHHMHHVTRSLAAAIHAVPCDAASSVAPEWWDTFLAEGETEIPFRVHARGQALESIVSKEPPHQPDTPATTRTRLVASLSHVRSPRLALWALAFDLCTELVVRYPGHEALWAHRRALFSSWVAEVLCLRDACGQPESANNGPSKSDGQPAPRPNSARPGGSNGGPGVGEFEYLPTNRFPSMASETALVCRCLGDRDETQRAAAGSYLHWVVFETASLGFHNIPSNTLEALRTIAAEPANAHIAVAAQVVGDRLGMPL